MDEEKLKPCPICKEDTKAENMHHPGMTWCTNFDCVGWCKLVPIEFWQAIPREDEVKQ